MQVVKPQTLGLSTRPIEYRKRFGLCVTASLHLPFAQAARGSLWGEQSMWNFLGEEMATPMIDEGVAKLTPEFLVHGRAFPPPGRIDACAVRAQFAGKRKSLLVFGDRFWERGTASAPRSFAEMPIDWEHAYGGADHASNPVGKGMVADKGRHALPNIERPDTPLRSPDQRVEPAGFGMLQPMHPQRARYRGTCDDSYLKEHAPGFAPDLDWKFFNLAPQDQWFDEPLKGDEPFSFDHLHPSRSHIAGRLPGLRARVFADYRAADATEPRLREVPLRLTTVWFFPHAERAIVLFQGLAEVATDDGSDVHGLMGAVERLGEPKADAHYLEVLARRADPRWGIVHSLCDSDLLPEGVDTTDPAVVQAEQAFASEGLQTEAQYRRAQTDVALAREEVRAAGRDPDALGIVMPPREKKPPPDQLANHLKQQMEQAELQQLHAIDDAFIQLEKAITLVTEQKVDPQRLVHRGPPRYSAEAEMAQLRAAAVPTGRPLNASPLYGKLLQKEGAECLGYLQSAHEQLPARPMPAAEAARLRQEMAQAAKAGARLWAGMDFTGADFSGLDLNGMNFAGAWLESVDFSKANLSGADFSHAVLAHCNLSHAIAIGTRFIGTNLGRARLEGAVFDDADLSNARLAQCAMAATQMRRSQLAGADLIDTTWGAADWSGVRAAGQLFYRRKMQGLVLAEAELSDAQFIECDLSGCDLRAARLARATFLTCKLDGARMAGAQAEGVVFAQRCSLVGADLSQAMLRGCNFGAADLSGARLVGSTIDGANLAEARLADCDMRLASAKGALMRRTVLTRAQLAGANLSGAILQHADLRAADLRRSNLFGADLSRVRLDGDVKFDHALLKRARTWPRLTPQQQVAP